MKDIDNKFEKTITRITTINIDGKRILLIPKLGIKRADDLVRSNSYDLVVYTEPLSEDVYAVIAQTVTHSDKLIQID